MVRQEWSCLNTWITAVKQADIELSLITQTLHMQLL